MYNFKTKNLKYNMHNLICIASACVIPSIDQFDLVCTDGRDQLTIPSIPSVLMEEIN